MVGGEVDVKSENTVWGPGWTQALTWLNLFSFSRSRCSSWIFLDSRERIRCCNCVISFRKKALSSCSWRRDWGCKSIVVMIGIVVGGVTSPVIRIG